MPAATKQEKNALLSVDEIVAIHDITEKDVYVPQWGGSVRVRSISKRQMREIKRQSKNAQDEIDEDNLEKSILLEGLVDPKISEEQYEILLDKSAAAFDTILKAIVEESNLASESGTEEEKTFRSRS